MKKGLALGKLSPEILTAVVYRNLGKIDSRVLVGPKIGEDAAVVDFGDRVLVVHSDPITGAVENIGWLGVNVCTNDVATRGATPLWISLIVYLPEGSTVTLLRQVMEQVDAAAKELGVAVISGHTEVTPGLTRPLLACTAIGEAPRTRFVTSSGAKAGDRVILTKGAAIEGTAILATEFADFLKEKVGEAVVKAGQAYIRRVSVLKDALTAMEVGGITAMHDATEGGVAGALYEVAYASNLGVQAYEEKVIVNHETQVICAALNVDPIQTISSGSLLIAAKPDSADKVVQALRIRGIKASIIGEFTERSQGLKVHKPGGGFLDVSKPVEDHLWKILPQIKRFRHR